MHDSNGSTIFSLSFEEKNYSTYPMFYIQGLEGGEFTPYISITGRMIESKLYYSKGGYSAETAWGLSEDGIFHTKDKQGFSINADLIMSSLIFGGERVAVHVTRFSPGYLPGYNAANNGEVYVTPDGTLKVKGYSVDS